MELAEANIGKLVLKFFRHIVDHYPVDDQRWVNDNLIGFLIHLSEITNILRLPRTNGRN